MSEQGSMGGDSPERPVMLEDVVTALQKTFSRVNAITQKNMMEKPNSPTSRLGRMIEFDATVRVSPHAGDYLEVAVDGAIDLRIKGQIQNDIEYILEEPKPNEAATPSPPHA